MNKWLVITLALTFCPVAHATTDKIKKPGADKAAKARAAFDQMDREDFLDGLEESDKCTQRNDFTCAEQTLARVKGLINSAEQERMWQQAKKDIQDARFQMAQQRELEQQRIAAQRAVERQEEEEARRQRSQMFAAGLAAFSGAVQSGMAEQQRQQAVANANNARLAAAQAAATRQREAEAAAQRETLRQRQAEQRAAYASQLAMGQQQAANQQAAREAMSVQRKAEAEALAAKQAAERQARIAQQERESRANAARQMQSFTASTASVTPKLNNTERERSTAAAENSAARRAGNDHPEIGTSGKPSRGKASAWCMQKDSGEFLCHGPFQSGAWGRTLIGALGMSGCPDGKGYEPQKGHGGQQFDCQRELKSYEKDVGLRDPFADNFHKSFHKAK